MEKDLSILSEKQRMAYKLYHQDGMKRYEIAQKIGVSYPTVTHYLRLADLRLQEYEKYMKAEERNNEVIHVDITRGELKIILDALLHYENELHSRAITNIKTDWRGRLPYIAQILERLRPRLQAALYGQTPPIAIPGHTEGTPEE